MSMAYRVIHAPMYLGAPHLREMRRTAWLLLCLAWLNTQGVLCQQQQCVYPSVTSTGTQNFARMCGAGGQVGACTATMINRFPNNAGEQYGGPEVAVDGIKATPGVQVQGQFLHTTNVVTLGGAWTLGYREESRESKFKSTRFQHFQ